MGYPGAAPAIFIVAAFAIVVNQIAADPVAALTGLGLVLIGLPVYFLWSAHAAHDGDRRPQSLLSAEFIDALRTGQRARSAMMPMAIRCALSRRLQHRGARAPRHRLSGACSTSAGWTRRSSRSRRRDVYVETPGRRGPAGGAGQRRLRARSIDARRHRFTALATLPLNDPAASVAELERVRAAGFRRDAVQQRERRRPRRPSDSGRSGKRNDAGAVMYIHPTFRWASKRCRSTG